MSKILLALRGSTSTYVRCVRWLRGSACIPDESFCLLRDTVKSTKFGSQIDLLAGLFLSVPPSLTAWIAYSDVSSVRWYYIMQQPFYHRQSGLAVIPSRYIDVHCLFVSKTRAENCDSHPATSESFLLHPHRYVWLWRAQWIAKQDPYHSGPGSLPFKVPCSLG